MAHPSQHTDPTMASPPTPAPTPAPTPTPTPTNPNPPPPHIPISIKNIKSAARKLPIKRKSPEAPETAKPMPFKFHRIWTEIDELRFLQGLLDSAPLGLLFPRDLPQFYTHFSSSTPHHPYSTSQLSEKLRRLRKKYRIASSRIARGLHLSQLSPHDQALFDLSKRLWGPEFAASSPFNANCKRFKSNFGARVPNLVGDVERSDLGEGDEKLKPNSGPRVRVRVRVGAAPSLVGDVKREDLGGGEEKLEGNLGSRIVKSEGFDEGEERLDLFDGGEEGRLDHDGDFVAAKAVVDVFDECLNEARALLVAKEEKESEMTRRWREQRLAEMDVLARRLRLVLENSIVHNQ